MKGHSLSAVTMVLHSSVAVLLKYIRVPIPRDRLICQLLTVQTVYITRSLYVTIYQPNINDIFLTQGRVKIVEMLTGEIWIRVP